MAVKRAKSLSDLLALSVATGVWADYTRNSQTWLRSSAGRLDVTPNEYMAEIKRGDTEARSKFVSNIMIGDLYFYQYDPKLKKTLPYYDMYPVVFPIQRYKDGFLGINLHYLPPSMRAKLMDALYDKISDDRFNFNTKLKMTYDILNSASKYRYFRPCVKRYLTKHVKGNRLLKIHPKEWEIALFLPLARFRKQTQEQVWTESKKIIRRR